MKTYDSVKKIILFSRKKILVAVFLKNCILFKFRKIPTFFPTYLKAKYR